MNTYTFDIQHEVDSEYANHRSVTCTLSVEATSYEEAVKLAEAKYFAEESEYITKYAKIYGMSFYQV